MRGNKANSVNKKLLAGLIAAIAVIVVLSVLLLVTIMHHRKDNGNQAAGATQEDILLKEENRPQDSEGGAEDTEHKDGEESVDKEQKGYLVFYQAGNTWDNNGVQMATMDISLKNAMEESISNWTLELEIEDLKSCEGWNGTYKVGNNKLTVTNAEYNGELAAGQMITLGCNIGTGSSLAVKSARLNGVDCIVMEGTADSNGTEGNNQNNGGQAHKDDKANPDSQSAADLTKRSTKAKQGDDWLHTKGNKILDKDNKEVWLTGVNWFGYNTGTNTFDGLWNSELTASVQAIADHGFNLIRVPMSAQLINQWAKKEYPKANYNQAYNQELNSLNSLEIFDYFLKLAEENGIKVMPDIHSAETDASGHTKNLWYTDKVSTKQYYNALEWMAARYKDNDTIIAYDLKNEPHGKPDEGSNAAIWNDSKAENNWKYVAQTAALKVLAKNPNVLVLVEGTEIYPKNIKKNGGYTSKNAKDYYFNWWGGNLRGVKDYPIDLGRYQDKLVYSPHDYGPTVYEQDWFKGSYNYDSLMKDCWRDNWFYIHEDKLAPLLIGEWGGFMKEPNLKWMTELRKLIKKHHINHTFWCFNANSGDTGGLVLDDFVTWDEKKYNFVKEVLWQENGKFVGLDHEIPLGKNGITLKNAKGL
ncbi:MAG: cellulase family glycosylhydrolase [Lachnospira sp.]|nr:cellulase family glycosylhydrolase [Lachnospira sp.]